MPYVPPAATTTAAAFNPSILEPAASQTMTDSYGLTLPGEFILDSAIELIVGGAGGFSEVHIT